MYWVCSSLLTVHFFDVNMIPCLCYIIVSVVGRRHSHDSPNVHLSFLYLVLSSSHTKGKFSDGLTNFCQTIIIMITIINISIGVIIMSLLWKLTLGLQMHLCISCTHTNCIFSIYIWSLFSFSTLNFFKPCKFTCI